VDIPGECCGISESNGALCWYSDNWTGYADDTPENRETLMAEWDRVIAERAEYANDEDEDEGC
jgi:hypothetical protein